jgi:hypothetical protein
MMKFRFEPVPYHAIPKGTQRYGTAPTGTFGSGPVGRAVPPGTLWLCPPRKDFLAAVPFGRTAWYGFRLQLDGSKKLFATVPEKRYGNGLLRST